MEQKNIEQFPLVSLTLIAFNRKVIMRESLEHLRAVTYKNLETIVVDNGSTDGTAEMIANDFPEVKLIKLRKNTGLFARSVSFLNTKGKYIVSLDDDSYPEPDAISKMVEHFERDQALGIIAFHVPCGDYFSTMYWLECRAGFVNSYIGCGAGIRRKVFEQIGFSYDLNLRRYSDDNDFAIRASAAGYTIGHFKNIIAHHRPLSNSKRFKSFFYQYQRNRYYLMGKYIPMRYWVLSYFRNLFFRLFSIYFLAGGKIIGIRASFYGFCGSIGGLSSLFLGHQNRIALPEIVKKHLIVNYAHSHLSLTKFLLFKNLRKREFSIMRRNVLSHQFCSQGVDYKKFAEKNYANLPSPIFKAYLEQVARFNIVSLRKESPQKSELLEEISRELEEAARSAGVSL